MKHAVLVMATWGSRLHYLGFAVMRIYASSLPKLLAVLWPKRECTRNISRLISPSARFPRLLYLVTNAGREHVAMARQALVNKSADPRGP